MDNKQNLKPELKEIYEKIMNMPLTPNKTQDATSQPNPVQTSNELPKEETVQPPLQTPITPQTDTQKAQQPSQISDASENIDLSAEVKDSIQALSKNPQPDTFATTDLRPTPPIQTIQKEANIADQITTKEDSPFPQTPEQTADQTENNNGSPFAVSVSPKPQEATGAESSFVFTDKGNSSSILGQTLPVKSKKTQTVLVVLALLFLIGYAIFWIKIVFYP